MEDSEAMSTVEVQKTIPSPTLTPPLRPTVHTPVAVALAVVTGCLTLFIVFQIYRVWRYKLRKDSKVHIALILSLFWGVLRTTLISIYAQDKNVAGSMDVGAYILLFAIPVCLQYTTFSLVILDFCEAATRDFSDRQIIKRVIRIICYLCNCSFWFSNIVFAVQQNDMDPDDHESGLSIVRKRVLVSESLSIFLSFTLCIAGFLLRKSVHVGLFLNRLGQTRPAITTFLFIVSLVSLFLSKSIYNIVAIGADNMDMWGYRFTFLSDRFSRSNDNGLPFVWFVIAVFVWEFLPVAIMVIFFWVSPSGYDESTYRMPASVVRFDNTKEDSDDDSMRAPLIQRGGEIPAIGESPSMWSQQSSSYRTLDSNSSPRLYLSINAE